MRRDLALAALLWAVLTGVGEALLVAFDFQPSALSDKGERIKDAVSILAYFAMPVLALVLAGLVYSVVRFRGRGPEEEGTPIRAGIVPWIWLGATSALAFTIMLYPGLWGTVEVAKGSSSQSLTVQVEGLQWTWLVHYPGQGLKNQRELVLPVGQEVTIEVTSRDVLHSFWVPALMMKIDAIPGTVNRITFTPQEADSYANNPLLRLQCAELCGLSHARMVIPVRLVEKQEFLNWVEQQKR